MLFVMVKSHRNIDGIRLPLAFIVYVCYTHKNLTRTTERERKKTPSRLLKKLKLLCEAHNFILRMLWVEQTKSHNFVAMCVNLWLMKSQAAR